MGETINIIWLLFSGSAQGVIYIFILLHHPKIYPQIPQLKQRQEYQT